MKNILILIFVLAEIGTLHAQKFGLKAGLNYSTISEDSYSYKSGFHAGVFALFNLSENIKLTPEIVYSVQGGTSSNGQSDYDYINIPVLVTVYETKHIFFQFGAQFGILTSAKFSAGGSSTSVATSLNKSDAALVAGLGADFGRLIVNARYNWGLTDIVKSTPSAIIQKSEAVTNSTIQLSIGVKLN